MQADRAIRNDPTKPGRLIAVNHGDSNNNGIPDFADMQHASRFTRVDIDLSKVLTAIDWNTANLRFEYPGSDPSDRTNYTTNTIGSITVTNYVPAAGHLRLWTKDGLQQRNPASVAAAQGPKGDYVPSVGLLPVTAFSASAVPNLSLYAEGIRPLFVTNQTLAVYLYPGDGEGWNRVLKDEVRMTVIHTDLDIDSDNNNELNDPDGSNLEEALEDHPSHPGKSLAINHLDRDKDGVPDYADGYDIEFGGVSQAAANASHDFVPVLLKFSEGIDINTAKVRFRGDHLSNPATPDITLNSAGGTNTYNIVGTGRIRLWRKNGSASRSKASVTANGDAIIKDQPIPLHMLSPTNGVARLYLEALKPSDALGDIRIKVELNPLGTNNEGDYIAADQIRATVFDVDSVHPGTADFDNQQAGKVLISAKHGGGFYTPYQTTNAQVRVAAQVKPVPPADYPNLKVYFEVTDPDDLSHYEGKTTPGTPNVQGDRNPNDNRDPLKRMTGAGADYSTYQTNCLAARSAAVVVTNQTAIAETLLRITNRYAGDNYQVRATLQKPHNLEPFDTRTSWTTNQVYTVSSIAESATLIAWKRVYIELDKMYTQGATLTENALSGATNLTVDSTTDFHPGQQIVVFWKNGSHNAQITATSPVVAFSGGDGGAGAAARPMIGGGAVTNIVLTAAGSGYKSVPTVSISGGPGSGAAATAKLVPTGIEIELTNGGANYTSAPDVQIGPPNEVGGVQATATATVNNGVVTGITVTNAGSGYTQPPTVNLNGGGGAGATANSLLQPTSIASIVVTQGGAGYVWQVTINPALPQAVPKYGGIRPAAEPGTYEVDKRYLEDAFGRLPDGSDGGAFIEFKDAPTGSGKVPKYAVFPSEQEELAYARYWFDNHSLRADNILYLLAANRYIGGDFGGSYPNDSICIVYDGGKTSVNQRDDTTAHEIGHRFGLVRPPFDHVDARLGELTHCGQDHCLMSYDRNRDNAIVEFSNKCLLSGSSPGADNSLRDRVDR